jgi:hypothetical protein
VLLLDVHHIAFDGWSMSVLRRELAELYAAFAAGESSPLPPLRLQVADHAAWQRERLSSGELEGSLAYWTDHLADRPEPQRSGVEQAEGFSESDGFQLLLEHSPALSSQVRAICQSQGVTPFLVLLTGFHELLRRTSGQQDLMFGTILAGRDQPELEGLIGLFMNTVVVRTRIEGEPTFHQLLTQVRGVMAAAQEHAEVPLAELVKRQRPRSRGSQHPFFSTVFQMRNLPEAPSRLGALEVQGIPLDPGVARLDLFVEIELQGECLRSRFEFSRQRFDADAAAELVAGWDLLLVAVTAQPDQLLSAQVLHN